MEVCVIGLGRAGLPIALLAANRGHRVTGVDIDVGLIRNLNRGRSPFFANDLTELIRITRNGFASTMKLREAVHRSEVILCCVGTGRFADGRPDLTSLHKLFDQLARTEIKGKLIVLTTTVPIGTTRTIAASLEEATGMRVDKDFLMAFSPVRTLEGRARELENLPVVVGAMGPNSLESAVEFYRTMKLDVVKVEKTEAAELIKLIDNAYRITRFGFANDLSFIAEEMGLNAFDVIDAANYEYPRNDIPYPSCGVSGYCLTKDPFYLEEAFKHIAGQRGFFSSWMLARRSYDFRVKHLVRQIEKKLKKKGIKLTRAKALICGLAFKSNIDDIRDSHGLTIANRLLEKGMDVSIWDPWITHHVPGYHFYEKPKNAFSGKDVAIFTVNHSQFNLTSRRMNALTSLMRTPLVYDGTGTLRKSGKRSFELIGTGLPDIVNQPK